MTWKLVETEWPLGSLAEQLTVVDPTGNAVPEAGVQLTVTTPATASVAVGFVYVTTVLPPGATFAFTSGAGPKTGGIVSWTVTLNDLLALLPTPSVAVQTTVVSPIANVDPDPGTQLTDVEAPRSVAVGVLNVTVRPLGDVASWEMSLGKLLITGSVVSWTVTLNDADEVFPCVSVAEQLTVVVVIPNVDPDGGEQVTPTEPDTASLAVGLVNVTTAPEPDVASVVLLPGTPLITGPIVSTTLTVNDADELFPCESLALQVTVVLPRPNTAPDAGEQTKLATVSSGSLAEAE
jgi:hypothetical protein